MSQRQWTFAVWMAGDNDLEKYADRDLAEIKKVGSTAEVAIVAQVDRFKDDRTRRYLLRKGGKVAKDQVQDLGETNSGDPAVASDFFAWALETYPADRFCAVLWNHGSGIDEAKARGARRSRGRTPLFGASRAAGPRPRGIGYDDTSADFLDNVELRQMLAAVRTRTGRTIDLLGMDACLMSLLEVALECAPYAQTLVSSQETEPLDGWPYDRLLADLVARPGQTARDLARGIVRDYVDSYKYDYVTLSALDLGERDGVVAGVDQLAEALLEATANGTQERLAFRAALAAAQRFDTRDFVDLGSLCCELAAATTAQPVRAACRRITTAIPTMVVAEEHRGKPVEQASGVSIYVPLGGVSVDYSRLRLARETRWGAFVSEAERWPRPSSGAAAARPSGRRRRSAVSNRAPVRVLAVHGIGGVERDLRWQPAWERLFRQGIGRFTDRAVEVDFLGLDDMFEAYPVTAGDALEALVKLGASGLYHGVKDALLGTRAFAPLDTVRWTAGMVVQWASNERLRESLRGRLSDRVAKGAPVDLLAAHSLGSLVTYDTFGRRENRKALARTALLTFGSQLGSPFVRGQFDGYIGPVGASFWCHAYNPYDPVFTAELRVPGDRFQQVVVGRNQPGLIADHDAVHYLADPGVIDVGLRAAAPAESTRRLGGVDAPSRRKAAPKPTRRALVVGIDDYPDPAARLDGCVNDA